MTVRNTHQHIYLLARLTRYLLSVSTSGTPLWQAGLSLCHENPNPAVTAARGHSLPHPARQQTGQLGKSIGASWRGTLPGPKPYNAIEP